MWNEIVPDDRYSVVAEATLPSRPARYAPMPERLHGDVRTALEGAVSNLYFHQAKAIGEFVDGKDVCLATATASGKSLVFMSCATDVLLRDSLSKCIVLYPAKALLMDQLERWRQWCSPFGLRVGHIHGEVGGSERLNILLASRVILMTPDVAHAWIMSHLSDNRIRRCMDILALLILDEAHVYEGVFGSNMAYFLRRLRAVAPEHRLLMTTATLGRPEEFTYSLTGRRVLCLTKEDDGAQSEEKHLAVISELDSDTFQCKVDLLKKVSLRRSGRFLAFADSRRMVELLTVATNVGYSPDESSDSDNDDANLPNLEEMVDTPHTVLPYRSGYEDHDRNLIQRALSTGKLAGVISTSAMELGLDIGDLDLVILFGIPATVKSFWQRVGRAGRRAEGRCVIVDTGGLIASLYGGLAKYLQRELEPNWLYLDNKKIQYTNALCAATESSDVEKLLEDNDGPFATLPEQFRELLSNEINPTRPVDQELLGLKQRAQANPQYEFPIRSGIEMSFSIKCDGYSLGSITLSQALREAYPGAIYYYMAKPYRVHLFNFRNKEIWVRRERRWTTRPDSRTKVFPDMFNGLRFVSRSDSGFLVECEMQVSEQVLGFKETRGRTEKSEVYDMASQFYHKPLQRFFATTGICWRFDDKRTASAAVADAVMAAYCAKFGIDSRDVGCGFFHAKTSPFAREPIQGVTIFDSTDGSLRLTQRLAHCFEEVVQAAIALVQGGDARVQCSEEDLQLLWKQAVALKDIHANELDAAVDADEDWINVIAPNETAVYLSNGISTNVQVIKHTYTPQGLKYRVKFYDHRPVAVVRAEYIQALHGESRLIRYNPSTGEEEDID